MVVAVETVVVQALNVATGVPIAVAIPVFTKEDVEVTYGIAGLPTVQNTDFTVSLLDPADFNTFTLTPLAALLTKINDLIAANPAEINAIYIRRRLDYKTSSTADAVKNTPYTSREFDRTATRFQQQNEEIKRAIKFVKSVTSGVELQVKPLTPNKVPIISADGKFIQDGPTADQVTNAQSYANAASASAAAALVSQNAAAQAYTDTVAAIAALGNPLVFKGTWDASAGTFPGADAAKAGWTYHVSVAGTVGGQVFDVNDRLIATVNNASATVYAGNWFRAETDLVQSVAGLQGVIAAIDLRDSLDTAPYVASRVALKALDTTKDTVAFLTESGREGPFVWRAGDFSSQVALDTAEGIYVKADAIAAIAGAWVRQLDDSVLARWFGASPSATAAANAISLQAAINTAKARSCRMKLDPGTYDIDTTLDISGCSNVVIEGEGTGTVIRSTSAIATIFSAGGGTAIEGFGLRDMRLTCSVLRTGTAPFIQIDPLIRKSYVQNVQADAWDSFMWLKQFETVIIEGVFADQMTTPPSSSYGIRLGTQSVLNQGAAVYIDKCQFRGGTTGSPIETNWSIGLLLHDVEGISVSNTDFQKFDTNFVGDPTTRLVNLFFVNSYFDATYIGPCMMYRGSGVKSEIQFRGGWLASAGQASGTPVATSGAYGLWLKGTGAYGRLQFDTEYYNCAQNAIAVSAASCDATFSGWVYSNAVTTLDNAIFSDTSAGNAAPSLENLHVQGGNTAASISYGANSTGYIIRGVRTDRQINLGGTPAFVDIVNATNSRNIDSELTLAVPQFGSSWTVTPTGPTFTSIAASWIDREITLIFQSARTVVTGGNISIGGGTFTSAAGSTLTLRSIDGANWYETSRKA